MTVVKKIGERDGVLYLSGERSLTAVPFNALREIQVRGNPKAARDTGVVEITYESSISGLLTVRFECKSVEVATGIKADIDKLLVAHMESQ